MFTRTSAFISGPMLFLLCSAALSSAEGTDHTDSARLARVFFQDHDAATIRWSDVRIQSTGAVNLAPAELLPGLRTLDASRQKLVQMAECGGRILVGVRDDDNGAVESGWVLIDSGVEFDDHGDHGHWTYPRSPSVWDSRLDKNQGNPAHLYVYDDNFYLANDRNNGYTRIDPAGYFHENGKLKAAPKPAFHQGGGNHITLAVVHNKVGYGCWIDGSGPNRGRVDVTPISRQGTDAPSYSFQLPTGAIHGAIACENKVFFAPADGICWIEADTGLRNHANQPQVHHISLGRQEDKPRRTGAFARVGSYVAFVTGHSTLVLLDARLPEPTPIEIAIPMKPGQKAVTPRTVRTAEGRVLAFIFHDHQKDADVVDELTIVDLDPNGDDNFADGKVARTVAVGRSAVEGHFGHHDIDFDADGHWGFFTNPGDGTLTTMSLKDLTARDMKIGGKPTAIVVRGGKETND